MIEAHAVVANQTLENTYWLSPAIRQACNWKPSTSVRTFIIRMVEPACETRMSSDTRNWSLGDTKN